MTEHVKENNQAINLHELTLQEDTIVAFSISFSVIKTLHRGFSLYLPFWGVDIAIPGTIILLQVATTSGGNNKFRNYIVS